MDSIYAIYVYDTNAIISISIRAMHDFDFDLFF